MGLVELKWSLVLLLCSWECNLERQYPTCISKSWDYRHTPSQPDQTSSYRVRNGTETVLGEFRAWKRLCVRSDTQGCPLASTCMCTQMHSHLHIHVHLYTHEHTHTMFIKNASSSYLITRHLSPAQAPVGLECMRFGILLSTVCTNEPPGWAISVLPDAPAGVKCLFL